MKKRIVSTLILILVVTLILSFSLHFVRAEDNLVNENNIANNEVSNNVTNSLSLNEQKEQVEQELEKEEEKLEYVQEELGTSVMQIQELDDRINEYSQKLDEINAKYKEIQEKVAESEKNLETANSEYEKKLKLLQKRLVAIYKKGETKYLDVLLNSKSIIDFVSKYYMVQRIVEYDEKAIQELEKRKEEIEKINNELQEDKANMKLLKVEAEKQSVVLTNTKTVYENHKNSLSESEKILNAQIDNYKKQQEELENLIQYAIQGSTYELKYSGGIMMWPTLETSYITSPYGSRRHPIQGVIKNHDGIDIGGSTGDPVYAAADGIVIYSDFNNGGYGNMIMVDHGVNSEGVKIVTLYAHGNARLKNVGDVVKKGDIIMEMGSTGNSTGPHVHFEVRENGVHVDPKKYLSSNEENENINENVNNVENEN